MFHFTHLVTLKRKPWFIYAQNEEDALTICKRYETDVVGVVCAAEGLEMKTVSTKISLVSSDVKLIGEIVESELDQIAKEIVEEQDEENSNDDKKLISQKS